jgi:pyrimidine operon attenuation protein / uracil phosphoribosyltransferase
MKQGVILSNPKFDITIKRLCRQLIENHNDFSDSVLIGLQPRGIYLSKRIQEELQRQLPKKKIQSGTLDVTFFRDDFRRNDKLLLANATNIDFIIENKKVILIDDVLFTGRTIRAGLDAMLAFGRPSKVELLVLIDRRYTRQLPIEPDYIGLQIDSIDSENVVVKWKESEGTDEVRVFESKTK